jgi:hypothetical protein
MFTKQTSRYNCPHEQRNNFPVQITSNISDSIWTANSPGATTSSLNGSNWASPSPRYTGYLDSVPNFPSPISSSYINPSSSPSGPTPSNCGARSPHPTLRSLSVYNPRTCVYLSTHRGTCPTIASVGTFKCLPSRKKSAA